MLPTLHTTADLLQDKNSKWSHLIKQPKLDPKKSEHFVCPILFDCTTDHVSLQVDISLALRIEHFDPKASPEKHKYLNSDVTWGRRGDKCALAVEQKNFSMLSESLLGKDKAECGTMFKSMIRFDPSLGDTVLGLALLEIFKSFHSVTAPIDKSNLLKSIPLNKEAEVCLFYAVIRSEQINNGEITPLYELEGYEDFILRKFSPKKGEKGLNQLTGKFESDVKMASFQRGYNLNAIFQSTLSNYASGFSDFKKSYQLSSASATAMDKGAEYFLANNKIRIAGINHLIIPSYLSKDLSTLDLDTMQLGLKKYSEHLFAQTSTASIIEDLNYEKQIYWINYIAYESDGNSFKITHQIKDVNNRYQDEIIRVFVETNEEFRIYIGGKINFSMHSLHYMIPIRGDEKSKTNQILFLYKDILERHPVRKELLFKHFTAATLCHRYKRHASFKNIKERNSFDFAIKDLVFNYHALFYALNQLNLINMETPPSDHEEKNSFKKEFEKKENAFFEKMRYNDDMKALFHLGKVINSIGYKQVEKQQNKEDKKKPILNKLNFNGMDVASIQRLSNELWEKAHQHSLHKETEFNFSQFSNMYNAAKTNLSKEENVFYLMTGYSFRLANLSKK